MSEKNDKMFLPHLRIRSGLGIGQLFRELGIGLVGQLVFAGSGGSAGIEVPIGQIQAATLLFGSRARYWTSVRLKLS